MSSTPAYAKVSVTQPAEEDLKTKKEDVVIGKQMQYPSPGRWMPNDFPNMIFRFIG